MAHPARTDAPALPADHPESPASLTHPAHPAWCAYRRAVMTGVHAARLVLEGLAADPGNPENAALAASMLAAMESLADLGYTRMIDESVLTLAEQAAYERGVADGRAGVRGCLRPVPGPR